MGLSKGALHPTVRVSGIRPECAACGSRINAHQLEIGHDRYALFMLFVKLPLKLHLWQWDDR